MYYLSSERRRLILIGDDFNTLEKIAESSWAFFNRHSVGIKIDIAIKVDRAINLMKYYEYDLALLCTRNDEEWDWSGFVKGVEGRIGSFPFIAYYSSSATTGGNVAAVINSLKPDLLLSSDKFDSIPYLIDETIMKFESAKEGSDLISTLRKSVASIKSVNSQVASQSAKILRLKKEQELQRKKLEGMLEFSQLLAVLCIDKMVETLKKKLPKIFGVELFSIFSLEDGLLSLVATNNPKITDSSLSFDIDTSPLMKEAVETGKPIVVENFSNSEFASGKEKNYTDDFAISIPIMREGEVLGILNMNGNRLGFFDNPDLTYVRLGVGLLSGALSNVMQHTLIQEMAITDGQTGLYNNRYFYKILGEEWEKVTRYGRDLSLIIVDIDFFKKVNDTYGHLSGDKVLSQMSQILSREARKVDTVARYGGEEFTVLLPETPIAEAQNVAERMRKAIESTQFDGDGDGEKLSITASFGVAGSKDSDFENAEALLKTADARLYKAKESGRNRVIAED